MNGSDVSNAPIDRIVPTIQITHGLVLRIGAAHSSSELE